MCFKQYRILVLRLFQLSVVKLFFFTLLKYRLPSNNTLFCWWKEFTPFHEKCKLLLFQSNILSKHCVICLSSLHCYKLSILVQAQYFMFVSSWHILNKDDFPWVMNRKDNIFLPLNLRTREGLMFFITQLGLSPSGETPLKHAWARFQLMEIDQNPAMSNLAYWFTRLVYS